MSASSITQTPIKYSTLPNGTTKKLIKSLDPNKDGVLNPLEFTGSQDTFTQLNILAKEALTIKPVFTKLSKPIFLKNESGLDDNFAINVSNNGELILYLSTAGFNQLASLHGVGLFIYSKEHPTRIHYSSSSDIQDVMKELDDFEALTYNEISSTVEKGLHKYFKRCIALLEKNDKHNELETVKSLYTQLQQSLK